MKEYLTGAMTFAGYIGLIDALLADGKTTGPNQSPAMLEYGKLNRHRMARLEKTIILGDEIGRLVRTLTRNQIWLIITEGWCGDAAQNIPVIEKIAAESDKIRTRYILRDQNLELIDQYLTNGARAIPKVIVLDSDTLEILNTWGSRPAPAQEIFYDLKSKMVDKAEISEVLQRWYNDDRGRSVQAEFFEILQTIEKVAAVAI